MDVAQKCEGSAAGCINWLNVGSFNLAKIIAAKGDCFDLAVSVQEYFFNYV